MLEHPTLEELARRAVDGDRDAVAGVVRELQGAVYALALRMLWQPQDAEDATQEILVRIVTRLAQFDFQSRLKTWAYRVATNYLLDVKKSCVERQKLSFTSFAADLAEGLSSDGPADHERSLLTEEVKIGCTLGMLQCLDRPHRLVYVLGEILELPAPEAAQALGLEPAAFRKRLQRAREAIETFTRAHCGLVSDDAACACNRRVPVAIKRGRISPTEPHFARAGSSFVEARELIQRVEDTKRVVELHRKTHPPGSSLDFTQLVVSALDASSSSTSSRSTTTNTEADDGK
ncbi:MAG: RNA polymerase sigma factor [Deltaproteobacteria bacterium]